MTRKTLYTLDVGGYEPAIKALTFPLLRHYAGKIGAKLHVINRRRFPTWPVVYEKLQIAELSRRNRDDWSIYFDADCLIHPETIDFTEFIPADAVAHNGSDMAAVRWAYDDYFRRDGRNIGSCTWLVISHRMCTADLWRPLDDLTLDQAVARIRPTVEELTTIKTPASLIDDYTLSRNIARFGLKFTTIRELLPKIGLENAGFFYHKYVITAEQKLREMHETIEGWNLAAWSSKRG